MKVFALSTFSLLLTFNTFSMDNGYWALQAKLQAQKHSKVPQVQAIRSPRQGSTSTSAKRRCASLSNIKIFYVENRMIHMPKTQVSLETKNYIRPQPTCLDRKTADTLLEQFEQEKKEKRAAQAALSATVKRSASAPTVSASNK